MLEIKVICVDDKNQPALIPESARVVAGEEYTVIRVVRMALQKDRTGVELREIDLKSLNLPYEYYSAERFRVLHPDELLAADAVEDLLNETLNK
jgi:hypothetical protein